MKSKQWGDYRITVSEMSWKSQLMCSKKFAAWLTDASSGQDAFEKQVAIATLITLHTPITLYKDDQALSNGTHDLGDGVSFVLPITQDCLESLPVSLAQFLVQSAQEENAITIANFFDGLKVMTAQLSATS